MNWAAFQLGGIIGCGIGIACIATGAFTVFPALIIAGLIWAIAGFFIASLDRGTEAFNNTLTGQAVRSSTNFVKTTTGKAVTGVAIAGLVTTATVASISPTKQVPPTSIQVATSTASSLQIAPTEIQPTMVIETLAPTQPPECAQYNLTPEECIHVGRHMYQISITGNQDCYVGPTEFYAEGEFPVPIPSTWDNLGLNTYGSSKVGNEFYMSVFTFYTWGFTNDSRYSDGQFNCTVTYTIVNE